MNTTQKFKMVTATNNTAVSQRQQANQTENFEAQFLIGHMVDKNFEFWGGHVMTVKGWQRTQDTMAQLVSVGCKLELAHGMKKLTYRVIQ